MILSVFAPFFLLISYVALYVPKIVMARYYPNPPLWQVSSIWMELKMAILNQSMKKKYCFLFQNQDLAIQSLQKELSESNLALSEARSLLSAAERQERELRERLDTDTREFKLRLHYAEVYFM